MLLKALKCLGADDVLYTAGVLGCYLGADAHADQPGREQRVPLIRQDIAAAKNGAVLSGSLVGWGDALIPDFTLAVRVVTDTSTRLARIKRREYARFGARILPGGDMYDQHQAFLQWAAGYDDGGLDTRSAVLHNEWQKQLACPILTVDGTAPLAETAARVEELLCSAN